jgi:hypothetical protein
VARVPAAPAKAVVERLAAVVGPVAVAAMAAMARVAMVVVVVVVVAEEVGLPAMDPIRRLPVDPHPSAIKELRRTCPMAAWAWARIPMAVKP